MICRSIVSVEKYTVHTRKISFRFLQHVSGINSTDIEDTRKVYIGKDDESDQSKEKIHKIIYKNWYKMFRDCYGGIKGRGEDKIRTGKLRFAHGAHN